LVILNYKMKRIIKINFKNFWEGFDPEDNLFTNALKEKYDIFISDKPDFLFCSIYPEQTGHKDVTRKGELIRKISPKLYVIIRKIYCKINSPKQNNKINFPSGNFIKILYSTEDKKPDMTECDWAFSPFSQEVIKNDKHFEIPVHLSTDFYFDRSLELPFNRKINFEKIKEEKTKFCNFIYSQEINFRNKFFKLLNKYKKIDAPGRCMNNILPIYYDTPRNSRRSNQWAIEKLKFLNSYKFTIAFENTEDHPYTTEKLVHPFLVNSIPIYLGNKNVGKYFNTESFINYNDFHNMDEFIEHIKNVDINDDLWKKYLEQPIFKTKEQHYFMSKGRFINKLNEIIETNLK